MSVALMPAEVTQQTAAQMAASAYWSKVRLARFQIIAQLKINWNPNQSFPITAPWIFVTAVEKDMANIMKMELRATQTFECSMEQAAGCFAMQTHRMANDEEIDEFKASRKIREDFCRKEEERVNPQVAAARIASESQKSMMDMVRMMSGQHESKPSTTKGANN
jgi:hypothetical protein